MSRLLCALVLLYCCCVPALEAGLLERLGEKAKHALVGSGARQRNTTSVSQLLEDLYYLDESVAELWQTVKVGLFVLCVVLLLLIIVPLWLLMYRVHHMARALHAMTATVKKQQ